MNIVLKRIYDKKVKLPKIVTSESSGASTIDPLSFVLHQIDLKLLIKVFTLTKKFLDNIMTSQLNQVSINSRQSNELVMIMN